MATKVFSSNVKPPKGCTKNWQAEDDKYVEAVRAEIKKLGYDEPYTGKEVHFGVGDGYARYMIMSLSPPQVMWLEIGDAWQFQYIDRMNKKDLRENADRIMGMQKLMKGQA